MRDRYVPITIIAVATLFQFVLAARWGLLADEAYYATWSEALSWGYYDQPPLIAWVLACVRTLRDHSDLGLRLPSILAGSLGMLVLARHHRTPLFAVIWWLAVPPLFWLTFFATPDAYLLGWWSVGIAAAISGGWAWLLVGLAGGFATLSKYSGLALFPLLWIATRDRSRYVLGGLVLHLLVILPHLFWLTQHDFESVRFQFHEGLHHAHAPGWLGPPLVVLQQLGVLTPLLGIAVLWGWSRRPTTRVQRIAWFTSAPLAVFFLIASMGGPPEAHWLAPAWIGSGLVLSFATGPLERLSWVGMGVGLLATLGLILHVEVGLIELKHDPANRVREGRVLAQEVATWVLPDGVGIGDPGVERAAAVRTERYQEASLIWWYSGIDAWAHPACGRENQRMRAAPSRFYFVRPPTTFPPTCVRTGAWHRITGQDLQGRVVGRWDLFEPLP